MDPLSAEIVVFQHLCDPVRHGSRPALGELRAASNARNGMQLDDDDNMQVESQGAADDDNMQVENQGAAVVEMLGGEPGAAQRVAAHRVEDAGSVRMAATVRLH